MDYATKKRRTLNYLRDILDELNSRDKGVSLTTYEQTHKNYVEAKAFLTTQYSTSDKELRTKINSLPDLVRPSIFTRELETIWALSTLGLISPFIMIMIITATFPVSLPYLIIRAFVSRQAKLSSDEARIRLTSIIDRLREAD